MSASTEVSAIMSKQCPAKMPRPEDSDDSLLDTATASSSEKDNEAASSPCELTYDVLTIIFKNLNARDLCNAARVCRCWSDAAANEKRIRRCSLLRLFGNLNTSWTDLHPGKEFVDHLRTKPMMGIAFTTPLSHDDYTMLRTCNFLEDCPCESLPWSCPNIIIGNFGLVHDQIELEEILSKATCMFLPEEQGVSVEVICVPVDETEVKKQKVSSPGFYDSRTAMNILKRISADKNKAKCFILLTNDEDSCRYDVLEHIPCDRDRTLAGGVVRDLIACNRKKTGKSSHDRLAWIVLAISGPSVQSWSTVLRSTCNTQDKVEAQLKLFRKQVQLKKHSVGFMFACHGRGEFMFSDKNVESTAFKQLFPEVPLVGSFGDGEYGDSTVERLDKRVHTYSTVFMILSYGSS